MANISKITLPNNNQYDIKDNVARGQIENLQDELENKVDKISGKSLSTNDYTTTEKNKLAGIAAEANKTIVDSTMSSTSTNPVQNKVINTALSGKLATTGDSKDLTTTFTSSDVADGSASVWTSVGALTNTEKHSSIFAKVSQMFKNVRYLFKMLGTTDISSIGNGTVSGALSTLNSDKASTKLVSTIDEMCSYMSNAPSGALRLIGLAAEVSNTILGTNSVSKGWFMRMSGSIADMVAYGNVYGEGYFVRYNYVNKEIVGNVIALPTRAEVDQLKSSIQAGVHFKMYGANSSGGSVEIPINSGTRGFLFMSAISTGSNAIYTFGTNSAGGISILPLATYSTPSITVTNDVNKITVTNSGATYMTIFLLTS